MEEAVEKHNITVNNLYNFDKKGFLIEIERMHKRVITHTAFNRIGERKNTKDGSREFISLLACISAIGKEVPSLLVYKGSNSNLQTSWVKDVQEDS